MRGIRYKFANGRRTHVVFDTKLYRGLLSDFLNPILGSTVEIEEVEKWTQLEAQMDIAKQKQLERCLLLKTEPSFVEQRALRDRLKGVRHTYPEARPISTKLKNPKLDMRSVEYITDKDGKVIGVALSVKYWIFQFEIGHPYQFIYASHIGSKRAIGSFLISFRFRPFY
jgi:hypothetical protein